MKISRRGFTLTELLIVVLVIGVLAAIALPTYTKSVKKSRASDALILADCHNYYSTMTKRKDCRVGGKKYFVGGKLPYVAKGGGCEAHHAYYNNDMCWEGGEYQGDNISTCNNSKTDAELCTQNCTAATCSFKCMRSESVPTTCSSYKCSNGYHCDNSEGSGVMLRCKRKN